MDPVVLANQMRANIDKCVDFNIMRFGAQGLVPAREEVGFRIVNVEDQGQGPEYVVAKGQNVRNLDPADIVRGPYVCPENEGPNNVQMVAGKRRSTRRTRKQKRSRKGKSRRRV